MRRFFVGTYSQGQGDIFTLTLDLKRAKLALASVYHGCENPSFLALKGNRLYAISERPDSGDILAFTVAGDGSLRPFASLSAPYASLCHLSVWPDGRALSAASYLGGGICTCALTPNGIPLAPLQWLAHSGHGPNTQRQESAHAHSITPDPSGRYLVAADLGADELLVYRPDGTSLALHDRVPVPSGEGPRHFAFHPSGRYGFAVTELQNHVIAYSFDSITGRFRQRQICPLLEANAPTDCLAADIHLMANGRFLFASVRGVPDIIRFTVTPEGLLEHRESLPCGAAAVRNFCLTRNGRYLLLADQLAGEVRLFALRAADGSLSDCLDCIQIPSPVCIIEA